jgi:hypothetical protein
MYGGAPAAKNHCVPLQRCDRQGQTAGPKCPLRDRPLRLELLVDIAALDSFAPHHFQSAPRAVAGAVPAGEDCLGPREGEVRALLSRGQPRSAAEITCYTRLGVHPSFFTRLLNANDELLRSWPALCKPAHQ